MEEKKKDDGKEDILVLYVLGILESLEILNSQMTIISFYKLDKLVWSPRKFVHLRIVK